MNTRRLTISAAVILMLVLLGCESKPAQPAAQPGATPPAEKKQPVLYAAKQCFTSMVNLAQRWQPDALPFHLESELTSETTGQGGKSTVWRAYFASANRGTMKTFLCSGSRLSSAPASGFTSTAETAYPPNVPGLMFQPSYLQTDSDKAFDLAQAHGGDALTKKDPQQAVTYLLDWDPKHKTLLWYVIYGKTQSEAKGIGVINAATGAFVRAGK
jgi:hypothetical protein